MPSTATVDKLWWRHIGDLHYNDGKVSKGYSFTVQKGICRVRERYVKGRFDELVVAQR